MINNVPLVGFDANLGETSVAAEREEAAIVNIMLQGSPFKVALKALFKAVMNAGPGGYECMNTSATCTNGVVARNANTPK